MNLNLTRPLAFFDLETTGTDVVRDRIVEISIIKVMPDGSEQEFTHRLNPGIPIPPGATEVHHISDEDVRDMPTFAEVADEINALFEGCDIAGFNSNKFDLPLLMQEFSRVGKNFDIIDRRLVDVQNIYHKLEPRTLVAAYRYYVGGDFPNAHCASSDTRATLEVLKAQLDRYSELRNDVEFLAEFSAGGKSIDLAGRFVRNEQGEAVINFGKHRGKLFKDVLETEPSFFAWMLDSEFSKNTKDVLRALRYKYQHPSK